MTPMTGPRKKPLIILGFILLPLSFYIGYTLGLMAHFGKLLTSDWIETFLYYLVHPLPLLWTPEISTSVLLAVTAALVIWIYVAAAPSNRMPGREYGAAHFVEPKNISRKYSIKNTPYKILGHNLTVSTDDRRTGRNNNMLVIGGSGSGKSFRIVRPALLHSSSSLVITDPKGELLRDCGHYLEQHGYAVKVLNLVTPKRSDHYNPLIYLREIDDVAKLVSIIIKNTTPANATQTDPFWEHAESLLLQSLILYVWLAPCMEGRRHLGSIIRLLQEAKISENEKEQSPLDRRMADLTTRDWLYPDPITGEQHARPGSTHPAYVTYQMVMVGAVDTKRSIVLSLNSRLSPLTNSPQILNLLAYDDLDFPTLGLGCNGNLAPTALFLVIPDADPTYNCVVGMVYSQLFKELYFVADNKNKIGRLPVDVALWMDEFPNIAMPNEFISILSTMRSRGISCNIIVQNLSQLKDKYKDSYNTILGNCDTLIYLGSGNELSSSEEISKLLGKWTISKRSYSSSSSRSGSTSHSDDILSRELMMPDEIRLLDNTYEIVLIRGEYPVLCRKYRTEKDLRFLEAQSLGPYVPEIRSAPEEPTPQGLIQIMLASQPEIPGITRSIVTSIAQLRAIDPAGKKAEKSVVEYNIDTCEAAPSGKSGEKAASEEAETTTPTDSIRARMSQYEYSDDQLEQAVLAASDGLEESQILEWFVPENSPKKMELSRKLQLQSAPHRGRSSRTR